MLPLDRQFPDPEPGLLIAATGWTLLALTASAGPAPTLTPGPWAAVAILGVIGTGFAYVINYALIRTERATRASVVTYLVSLTLGATALTEPLTLHILVGTGLILMGIGFSRGKLYKA